MLVLPARPATRALRIPRGARAGRWGGPAAGHLGRPLTVGRQMESSGSIRELRRRRSTTLRTPPG